MITNRQTGWRTGTMVGLSTDEKPIGLENASSFVELDTGKTYLYDAENTEWVEQPTHGGGGGGGGESSGNSVRFIDYDGTVVNSYSRDDFLALSEMPANPAHEGLVAQGWNWSFENALAYIEKYPDAILTIGQMYTTDNGDTRLYIYIDPDTPANRMTFYVRFQSSVANNVTIDWGDGTVETKGSTSATNYQHTYASTGEFVIKLTVNSGTILFSGTGGNTEANGESIYGNRSNGPNSVNKCRIKKVEIGNNVTSISDNVFRVCASLASITMPNNITSIGGFAFGGCYSLVSITIPMSVNYIAGSSFIECRSLASISIPDGVTSIVDSTFKNCVSLTSITIPDSVTSIGYAAFESCGLITHMVIPDGVTSIGANVFASCSSISSIKIPDGVTSIGDNTFNYCASLTSITIPDSVTSIGNRVFQGCRSLQSIGIPDNVTNIGKSVFYNCNTLTSVTIPKGVKIIDSELFYQCYALASVTMPDAVTSIGSKAFATCYSLASIAIPDGVTSIGDTAFSGSYSLASITIPNSVTNIGSYSFYNCYGVGAIHILGETPPTLAATNAFSGIPSNCVFYVPYSEDHSVLETYKMATNWSSYASKMVEESA